jgi:hypothetical protein
MPLARFFVNSTLYPIVFHKASCSGHFLRTAPNRAFATKRALSSNTWCQHINSHGTSKNNKPQPIPKKPHEIHKFINLEIYKSKTQLPLFGSLIFTLSKLFIANKLIGMLGRNQDW